MKTALKVLIAVVVLSGCGPAPESPGAREEVGRAGQELLIAQPQPQLPPLVNAHPPISFTSMTPLLGFTGTGVTVTGANFTGQTLRPVYRFSGDPVSAPELAVTVVSATQLRVTVPAGSLGGRLCVHSVLTGAVLTCTASAYTVGDPNGRVRIVNNAQTDLISAVFNGGERLAPNVVSPGTSRDVAPVTPGAYSYSIAIGFGPFAGPAANRQICAFNSVGPLQVPANATTTITVPSLNVPQLLGHCGFVDYQANYLDDHGLPRQVTLRFIGAANRWEFWQGALLLGAGPVNTVAFPLNSPAVTFALGGAGWADIITSYPYDTFVAGPAGGTLLFQRVGAW